MRKIIVLAVSFLLAVTPVFADGGQVLDGRWLCTNIDGNVTEETPDEMKDNYDLYVNKAWYTDTLIPEGELAVGPVYTVSDIVDEQLLDLMKDKEQSGHDAELVQKLYTMMADWDYRNALGVEPIKPTVEAIQAIDSLESLYACMFDKDSLVSVLPAKVEVDADPKDSSVNITKITVPGLLLSDAAEYTTRTQAGDMLYSMYQQIIQYALERIGFSAEEAEAAYENAIALETLLAAHIKPNSEHYQPDYNQSILNYYNEQELENLAGSFPIIEMMKASGLYGGKSLMVYEPDYISSLAQVFTEENVPLIRDWLLAYSALGASNFLDQDLFEKMTDIQNAVQGVSGKLSDDEYITAFVRQMLPVPLDNLYIENYCTEQQKEEITAIINSVLAYYHDMLGNTDWLSEETREKAVEKLDNMRINAVYPDSPADWSGLEFAGNDENGNLLAALKAIKDFKNALSAAKIDQPVDRDEWDQISRPSYTVNASYYPLKNSINIFAGFLNGDYYNSDFSYEQKLGSIGAVIGHEISHAFDTSGAQFDKNGSMNNWWTEE
ncbi:MAG: M13 family metallopeptidase, partial [Parasporobacterium sp.]|nr:M13 family metallopeptidase [Parasporobacterium sp.]